MSRTKTVQRFHIQLGPDPQDNAENRWLWTDEAAKGLKHLANFDRGAHRAFVQRIQEAATRGLKRGNNGEYKAPVGKAVDRSEFPNAQRPFLGELREAETGHCRNPSEARLKDYQYRLYFGDLENRDGEVRFRILACGTGIKDGRDDENTTRNKQTEDMRRSMKNLLKWCHSNPPEVCKPDQFAN